VKRIPKTVIFPGGFRLSVVVEEIDDPENNGTYDTVTIGEGVITLSDKLTPRQQWRILAHEMIHAVVDAQNYIERVVAP